MFGGRSDKCDKIEVHPDRSTTTAGSSNRLGNRKQYNPWRPQFAALA
jgi:hypothetical protein